MSHRPDLNPALMALERHNLVTGGTSGRDSVRLTGGAVLLAAALMGSQPQAAQADAAQTNQIAMPAVMDPSQADLYRRIFRLQHRAEWITAERETTRLADRRLLGHVLAHRYLTPNSGRASFLALADWLQRYADHPDAPAIHALAERRRPSGNTQRLRQPINTGARAILEIEDDLAASAGEFAIQESTALPRDVIARASNHAARAIARIRARVRVGDVAAAIDVLYESEAARTLTVLQADHMRAQIAQLMFAQDNDVSALAMAQSVVERSGDKVPRALWVAGLVHVKRGEHAIAAEQFEAMALSSAAQSWDISAGAFWAARMNARLDLTQKVDRFLRLAADQSRTFYGVLAARRLDRTVRFDLALPPLLTRDVQILLRVPIGARALALMQIGEDARAESELRRLYIANDPQLARLLLPFATRANMAQLTLRLARDLAANGGGSHFAAFYPMPHWRPDGGYSIDPALVFAVMRQESAFNPRAVSSAGARGLMQLMPDTAEEVAGATLAYDPSKLFDPRVNIAIAQRYMTRLLDHDAVRGDLIRLAAAYNGGPANLSRWLQARIDCVDDPLLFVETLPSPETRNFIVRVLFNYWVYQAQLGRHTSSLDQLAFGEWPNYVGPGGFETREARAVVDASP
jgi:soluble lytic murein transglycosylase